MERPLRVLHVAQPVDGGVAAVVATTAADQVRRGWEVLVACPPGGTLSARAVDGGARWLPWAAARAKRAAAPGQVRALRRLVRDAAPDVVHLHSASAGITGRLALRGRVPTLFSPHGWSWLAVEGPLRSAALRWERWARRWCQVLVCVSETERETGRLAGVGPAEVVANGVDLTRFPPVAFGDRAPLRRGLGLADVPTAVCVARLDEQKGQRVLVDAWPRVRASVPDAVLVLVGEGPAEEAVRAAVASSGLEGAVVLAGAADDVRPWYGAADVVLLSSLYGEGLPLTPMEAQASGRAVVASDVSGVRGTVAPDTGAVVPPGDVGAFAREVARLLADPASAEEEGARARRWAESQLDVRRSLDRLAELVRAAAGGRGPA